MTATLAGSDRRTTDDGRCPVTCQPLGDLAPHLSVTYRHLSGQLSDRPEREPTREAFHRNVFMSFPFQPFVLHSTEPVDVLLRHVLLSTASAAKRLIDYLDKRVEADEVLWTWTRFPLEFF